jgi:hypothetical protein
MAEGNGKFGAKWAVGILIGILIAVGGFAGKGIFGSERSLQDRMTAIEVKQAQQEEALSWIKEKLTEIKTSVDEIKREVKK